MVSLSISGRGADGAGPRFRPDGIEGSGLTNAYVTIDNYDWYLNYLLEVAKEKNKNINLEILRDIYLEHIYASIGFYDKLAVAHIGRSLVSLFLDDLIAYIKEKGWKIISPRSAYQDQIALTIPDVLFNGQSRVAAIARQGHKRARTCPDTGRLRISRQTGNEPESFRVKYYCLRMKRKSYGGKFTS